MKSTKSNTLDADVVVITTDDGEYVLEPESITVEIDMVKHGNEHVVETVVGEKTMYIDAEHLLPA
jgi:hypothetical protein